MAPASAATARQRGPWLLVAAVVVAAVAVTAVFWSLYGRKQAAAPVTSATQQVVASTQPTAATQVTVTVEQTVVHTETPTPTPSVSSEPSGPSSAELEATAEQYLQEQAAIDGARVLKNSQYMAQLASKYVGVTDPLQTTATGSHTFMAVDIWNEYVNLRNSVTDGDVVLLDSRTYGKKVGVNGKPMWVVAVLHPGFTDNASVIAWCQYQYPHLSGKELSNVCMPSRLKP